MRAKTAWLSRFLEHTQLCKHTHTRSDRLNLWSVDRRSRYLQRHDKHKWCSQLDSNPWSQQSNGRRLTLRRHSHRNGPLYTNSCDKLVYSAITRVVAVPTTYHGTKQLHCLILSDSCKDIIDCFPVILDGYMTRMNTNISRLCNFHYHI
jgi:hypothetical protein